MTKRTRLSLLHPRAHSILHGHSVGNELICITVGSSVARDRRDAPKVPPWGPFTHPRFVLTLPPHRADRRLRGSNLNAHTPVSRRDS